MWKYSIVSFLIVFLEIQVCFTQSIGLKFEHISKDQGLSQSEVNCICQDSKGFLWIGTLDGLNRFDGYDLKIYQKNTAILNSISSNYILSLFEDKSSNLWIGTMGGGFNKYNKEKDEFISCRTDLHNSKSVADDNINIITQVKSGDLLFGTQKGLSILRTKNINAQIPVFDNYFDFEITAIQEDKKGVVWLASWEGLYKLVFNKSGIPIIVAHYTHTANDSKSIISNGVSALILDRDGALWIGTNNGLDFLDRKSLSVNENVSFIHFQSKATTKTVLSNNQILAIHEDKSSNLFIGTRGGGLNLFDKKKHIFTTYTSEKYNNKTLSNNSIKCFFEDRTSVLWIGTLGGGVNKLDLLHKPFKSFEIIQKNSEITPSNFIRAIYEDQNKLLWIGTLDGGLFTFDRKKNLFSQYKDADDEFEMDRARRNSFKLIYGKNVFSILDGNSDQLWIGTNGGINILNTKSGKFAYHTMDYHNADSLISNSVFSIAKDDDGSFWIGTWGALHHYLPATVGHPGNFVRYTNDAHDSTSLSDNIVRYIYNDPTNSDMWICTMGGGLSKLMKIGKGNAFKFMQYRQNQKDPKSISSNEVNMIIRSKAGDLWIATNDGLNKLTSDSKHAHGPFIIYKEEDGLAGNHVQSILEDGNGNLWLGTTNGLSKFNPKTKVFNNYDVSDGLLSNEFSEHTCYLSKSGEMFFGGVNGFNSFYPDSIQGNNNAPKTQITNLLIFNRTVTVGKSTGGRVILKKSITETPEIELSYKDNVFTLEFSALHYISPEKNRYAYKLDGFNDNWLYTDAKNRKATYTNLKGGTYTFRVKASNNDGVWQTIPTTLTIHIIPPIWRTLYAYFIYLIVLFIITYAIYREIRTKERLKSELTLKNLEKEKAEELNQLKLQFFTNISHEFRTPLTLIVSPIENILGSIKGNTIIKEQLSLMHRNAKYLLRLINELMDFRKAETGSLHLSAGKNDLISFVKEAILPFDDLAVSRDILFQFSTDISSLDVWFDREMLTKILNNLIYNAFKFTSNGGQIKVLIEHGRGHSNEHFLNRYEISEGSNILNNCIAIIVKDNGIGISGESIKNIFNRYYQVGSSDSVEHMGSGIGLALTKNLVLLAKGEIFVASERHKGTEFIIRLPLGDTHLLDSEKESLENNSGTKFVKNELLYSIEEDTNQYEISNTFEHVDNTDAPLILVVEDNVDMRYYIRSNLERKFKVLEAENGVIGYQLAIDNVPDLIVSDIAMPEMGGIQLCKKLKKDIITSHIPVVLLTALTSVSNQIEGLETGADDYISKPFNYKLFEIRIENLILSRKKLRERFSKEIELASKDFTLNWRDQNFLDKAIHHVKEKISEPELSVDNLSKEIGMSRMHLHRKITALTDQTPSEFIRTIRLKEAARLLAENNFSISEIAYKVGFTAPSYFTTCFGKQFGLTPKEYLAKYTK